MSGIKTINNVLPAVKRPFRLNDLQDVWQGMNDALASGTQGVPRVISGFGVNASNNLTSGVIAFNGQLYFYSDATPIPVGSTIYAKRASSGDTRTFADSSQQVFSFDNTVTRDSSGNTLIGVASIANVETWRAAFIPAKSITPEMLTDEAGVMGWLTATISSQEPSSGFLPYRVQYKRIADTLVFLQFDFPAPSVVTDTYRFTTVEPIFKSTHQSQWIPVVVSMKMGVNHRYKIAFISPFKTNEIRLRVEDSVLAEGYTLSGNSISVIIPDDYD